MAGNKTRDGISLSKILKVARDMGATIRTGTKHPFVLNYEGMRACPVAASSNARRMIAPWISKITNYTPREAFEYLRNA